MHNIFISSKLKRAFESYRFQCFAQLLNAMFPYQWMKYTVLCFIVVLEITIAEEAIIFPTTNLHKHRTFELLSKDAVSTQNVIEFSRAAEAFSLEYFQVPTNSKFIKIAFCFKLNQIY